MVRAAVVWLTRHVQAHRARTVEQRRARTVLGAAGLFALVVVGTSFPLSALLSQRGQMASDAGQLAALREENAALARQAAQLHDPGTVDGLARHDYGLVRPGQKAYAILPPAGSSTGSGSSSPVTGGAGHVPLDGPPVVPGSARAQKLMGVQPPAPRTRGSHGSARQGHAHGPDTGPPAPPPGFWTRVVRNLEFWH
jgi:cell division protein FtsB